MKTRPTYITFFVMKDLYGRVTNEMKRSFEESEAHLVRLIRVIALFPDSPDPINTQAIDAQFAETYAKLVAGEPVSCKHTNVDYDPAPAPDIAVVDFFALHPLRTMRSLSKKPVKIFVWYSGGACSIIPDFGPSSMGGKGDLYPKVKEVVAQTGRDLNEVATEILFTTKGEIVRVPGLPPAYDYQLRPPQETPVWARLGLLYVNTYDCFTETDGIVLSLPECYEPEALAAVRKMCEDTNRTVYAFGPLLAFGKQAIGADVQQSGKGAEIQEMLDSILKSHGPQSLVYWSFGSIWWPTDSDKVWEVLDVLMEKKIPFIMNHASQLAVVPEAVQDKVKNYDLGMLVSWAPQQMILGHPATGWFVTHAGFNGVIESLSQGVPMICWPLSAEQPINTLHATENLDVAYELLEVRSGIGLKPILRTGKTPVGTLAAARIEAQQVLEMAFGADGAKKRENALKMKEAIARSWDEDGTSTRDLRQFLSLVDQTAGSA
ncbi:glycosyltransferase family 1 protein [Gelatoporia subvermispora B]|uniref:Glycosyltransferase family 1 protein n=1 Tax=Ceriporiopsis subvermispora (strain B) TaxID=914234 RepID=M2R668_CERS8|nr:glycosyltransferase family 1 protein [Gelatoporia subvermispora B]